MKTAVVACRQVELAITVDDCDAYLLDQYTWSVYKSRNTYYACTSVRKDGYKTLALLHRIIMRAPEGVKVDHADGNGLNCVRSNMRLATDGQNAQNARRPVGKTGYRGVRKSARGGNYYAQIKLHGILRYLGTFRTAVDAAVAYDKAASELHGEFAVLNFPKLPETG